ncbi:hypothetical protein LOK74_05610 [Brevibacillus humidisoli]|uniref:hypothetical protein n=1 Tax=Brevibacillus humidisoli TaxID=2895522 RepID=UPI001E3B11E2|nr:hypothetical protein [Brevibacillus humidisoli]UFJ41978.1 hypothetical protein LOK74_05610 [Brevibacillus humidisoli]
MNVIGIVQTDLNEFNILFEDHNRRRQDGDGSQGFFGFGEQDDRGGGEEEQQNFQEMTVRIKGVPEGQKATFLQMYQIIQDAREMHDLERNLTIVNNGDEQNQQGHGTRGRQ